jgi:hypothetical protein
MSAWLLVLEAEALEIGNAEVSADGLLTGLGPASNGRSNPIPGESATVESVCAEPE